MVPHDYDYDRIEDDRVTLQVFRWVCRRPHVDPLGINDSWAIGRHQSEALEYLLDKGGWRDRAAVRTRICRDYDVITESGAPPFDGSWREWTQAVHHGFYPRELVRLPRGAMTQKLMDARRAPLAEVPKPKKRIMQGLEEFLQRQAEYRLAWQGFGYLVLWVAGALAVYFFWQAMLGLFTTYLVVYAIASAIKNP